MTKPNPNPDADKDPDFAHLARGAYSEDVKGGLAWIANRMAARGARDETGETRWEGRYANELQRIHWKTAFSPTSYRARRKLGTKGGVIWEQLGSDEARTAYSNAIATPASRFGSRMGHARCTAKTHAGHPCGQPAILGADLCRHHVHPGSKVMRARREIMAKWGFLKGRPTADAYRVLTRALRNGEVPLDLTRQPVFQAVMWAALREHPWRREMIEKRMAAHPGANRLAIPEAEQWRRWNGAVTLATEMVAAWLGVPMDGSNRALSNAARTERWVQLAAKAVKAGYLET